MDTIQIIALGLHLAKILLVPNVTQLCFIR